MKLVVSVNVLPNYISDLLFTVSCLLQFSSLYHPLPLFVYSRSQTSLAGVLNVPRVLHIAMTVIKLSIKNKHNKFFIMLKRNSVKISLQTW